MTDELIMNKVINDLVENRKVFDSIKCDLENIISEQDDCNEFHMTYDEFCISCLDKLKKKNLKMDSKIKTVKQHFFESMIEIIVEELEKIGRVEEAKKIKDECSYDKV